MKHKLDARKASLRVLAAVFDDKAFVNLALADVIRNHDIDDRDKRLAAEIAYGVVTHKLTLDWIIQQVSGRPAQKLDRPVLYVLYIGLYQLFYLGKIPLPAAVHSTVELVKSTKKGALAPFVNGVMRGAVRRKETISWPDRTMDEALYLSVRYAHPLWMVRRWLSRMDSSAVEELLMKNNEAPPVTIRANTLCTNREKLLSDLKEADIDAVPSHISAQGIILAGSGSIADLSLYQRGCFLVQGESAMLVSEILHPQPGSSVLDMCSAPGGKTTHLAELMENSGRIVALDLHEHRLQLVRNNAKRLGVHIIETHRLDGQELSPMHFGMFDHVLLDVPCSGLGVIRRKPDIKWRRNPEDIEALAAVQKTLLHRAAAVMKPGATMVYSTCTNEPEETEDVICSFLKEQPEFMVLDFAAKLPAFRQKQTGTPGIQLYPHLHRVDGFYLVKLKKTS